jgi:hypothetical protein
MRYELIADEMQTGQRSSDESPWVKLHFGEYYQDTVGELYKIQGKRTQYKITIERVE